MRDAPSVLTLGLAVLAVLLGGALLPAHSATWHAAALVFGLLSPFVIALAIVAPLFLFELARRTLRAVASP